MTRYPALLTDAQLAKRLTVSPDWLRREARAGRLPHVRAGSRFLFDPETIEQLLLERARRAPESNGGAT